MIEYLATSLQLGQEIAVLWTGEGSSDVDERAVCERAGRDSVVIDARHDPDWIASIERLTDPHQVAIVRNALVGSTEARQPMLREKLIALHRSVLLVERASDCGTIQSDFPGFFRGGITTYDISSDEEFDTGNAFRLERIAASLPPAVTRGETLIVNGRVQRKSPEVIDCPKCGTTMTRGTTTITFNDAPKATRVQSVDGWICNCGESYIPGPVARAAHERAFAPPKPTMSEPISTNPIPGTRDFFPEEMSVRVQVFDALYRVVESFGYLRYDGPMLEPFELYAAKSSEEIVSRQTYRLKDRGDRELVVRPEMTPTVARMIAAKAGALSLPARWYSHPNLWRYERKQRGRYREHWQVNVDVFGTESFEAEAEILELCGEMMFALGAGTDDFLLRVSDRGLMQAVLTGYGGVPGDKLLEVYAALDAVGKVPEEETRKAVTAVDAAIDAERVLRVVTGSAEELFSLAPAEALAASNVHRVIEAGLCTSRPVKLVFDPKIIRGFTYYTSTVFEIFDVNPVNPRSIAGGGRYDNLVGLFGKARIPGLGFGMGDVTLIDFLETHGLLPAPRLAPDATVLAPSQEAADRKRVKDIALALRTAGLRVTTSLEPRKMGKLLEKASKEGVRFAVIAGADEAGRGAVKLRDLARSQESEVALGALAGTIRAALGMRPA
jgi:histidyl-tRNA synthetase